MRIWGPDTNQNHSVCRNAFYISPSLSYVVLIKLSEDTLNILKRGNKHTFRILENTYSLVFLLKSIHGSPPKLLPCSPLVPYRVWHPTTHTHLPNFASTLSSHLQIYCFKFMLFFSFIYLFGFSQFPSRDIGLIPGLGRLPGEGHGRPLQYSCLKNPTDRGAWWATAHRLPRVGHDWSNLACIMQLPSCHSLNMERTLFIVIFSSFLAERKINNKTKHIRFKHVLF